MGTVATAFLTNHEKRTDTSFAGGAQLLEGADLGGRDSLGITAAPSVQ